MKKQQGFTLIELVIVVIILGLLGAAAVPRFLDATDDARDASVEGVAGGFASAVGLVRAEWELSGRPATTGTDDVSYDGVDIEVTESGYPGSSGSVNVTTASSLTADTCKEVFDSILQSAPRSLVYSNTATYNGETYIVDYANDLCQYVLASDLEQGETFSDPINNGNTTAGSQGFTYDSDTGSVTSFKN